MNPFGTTGTKELFLMISPQNGKILTLAHNKDQFQDFFLLIYINELLQGLHYDVKLSGDGTLQFSVMRDADASSATLNNDQVKIQEWVYNWKMFFNPDRNKLAQEVIFSTKTRKVFHPDLYFNDQSVERSVANKHLGLTLDEKISFTNCLHDKSNKTLKSVGLLVN